MRESIERLLAGLDERQQKILLGVLVERLLKDEKEEILFDDADRQAIGYFLPHEIRMQLDHARLVAELEHPDGLPPLDELVAVSVGSKTD